MKKNFLSALAMTTLLFAASSCSQDDELIDGGGSKEQVSFQIEMEGNGVSSRAIGDGTQANKIYYEVWDTNTDTKVYDTSLNVIDLDGGKRGVELTLELVKGVPYDLLFWAQNDEGSAFFNPQDLKNVEMNVQGLKANQESYDAFSGYLEDFKVQSNKKNVVTLTRPFAQVNVGTTVEDWEKAVKLGVEIDRSTIVVKNVPSKFNVLGGVASEEVDLTYALADVDDSELLSIEMSKGNFVNYHYLGMNYMLANPTKALKNMTIDLYDGDTKINTIDVANMPIQRNYRTNVVGNLLVSDEGFQIIIDAAFSGDHVVKAWDGSVSEPKYNEETGTWEISSAAELGWIAQQINGTVESKAAHTFSASDNVTLVNDIDLNNQPWAPIGAKGKDQNSYKDNFCGTFDGAGHTIYNLNVSNDHCAGLFGTMITGTIKNVNLKNVTLNTNHYAGAVVAWVETSGNNPVSIENCTVDNATITVVPELIGGQYYDNGDKVGGVVGFLYKATIKECTVTNSFISAYRGLGGIVGYATGSTLTGNKVETVTLEVNRECHDGNEILYGEEGEYKEPNVGNIVGRVGSNLNKSGNSANAVTILYKGTSLVVEPKYDETTQTYTVGSQQELLWLVHAVNGTLNGSDSRSASVPADKFENKTFTLNANIDLAGMEWTPIGGAVIGKDANGKNIYSAFEGTFDGNNKTISNLVITGRNSNVGLFGVTRNGEIKNLTVNNAKVNGRLNVGVVAGQPYTSQYNNIKVTGHVEVNGMAYVGTVGGKNAYADWSNVTVEVDNTSYVKAESRENGEAYRSYVGGVVGFNGEGSHTFESITSNINVYGSTCDVGGLFGIAHYGNKFKNCSSSGDVEIYAADEAEGAEEIGGIAGVWHNATGETVTFTDCSFTGSLKTNIEEGVDLSDNVIVGDAYSSDGKGELIIDGTKQLLVTTADEITEAVASNTASKLTLVVMKDITGNATVVEKDGIEIIVEGGKHTWNGAIVVDGKSARNEGAGLTIQNVNFNGTSINEEAYINLGKDNNKRYTDNVTVKNCTFSGSENKIAAVKSYTGGDYDLNIIGCTVDEGMHSLAQLTNVEQGLKFEGCVVKSKNGVNLNNTPTFDMTGCTFEVRGYAIRVGVKGTVNDEQKTFNVTNSSLKSDCEASDDAVIVFRDNATYAKLTLRNTTLEGKVEYLGNTTQTTIEEINE